MTIIVIYNFFWKLRLSSISSGCKNIPNTDDTENQNIGGHTELMRKLITPTRSSAEVQIRLKQIHSEDIEGEKRI